MTTSVAHQRNRPTHNLRAWAMACAALAAVAGGAVPSAAAAAAQPASAAEEAVPVLDKAQLDALFAKPADVVVVDVRRPDEISRNGGFPAYLSIQAADLERFIAYIPRDRQIVTVSNHAARAKRAAVLLTAKGFRVVGAAGAQDYEAQGGRLVGTAPATAAAPAAAQRPAS